jgi:hypothetical protein
MPEVPPMPEMFEKIEEKPNSQRLGISKLKEPTR